MDLDKEVEIIFTKRWKSGGICVIEQHAGWLVGGFEYMEVVPEWLGIQ